jgi:N-acetylmuramoyl-L-alanine amidase
VPLLDQRGYPAAHASRLAGALGLSWTGDAMEMDGTPVVFTAGSAFFAVGDEVYQLPNPAYREGTALMIPVSWALDWLPRARPRRWRYLDGRLVERPATTLRPPERENWLVVIDAGHGGRDPGTIGIRGTREKDITLDIAMQLARRLEGERDLEVLLTRDRDTLVALADRPRIAQIQGYEQTPALFLSIHGNSMPRKPSDIRGVETYFLAVAKTEHARQVAMRENAALEFETDTPEEFLEPLQFILSDLQSAGNLQESSLFASTIDVSLQESLSAPSLGVKQAGLVVLANATMPAVLVEVGFLSNRDEEKLLRSSSYRAKIADALAEAVVRYLAEYGQRVWSSYGTGG